MEWLPRARDEVTKVAVRFEVRADVPSFAAPSKKETVPVGATDPAGDSLTVAVNVTLLSTTWGLALEERVVVVAMVVGATIVSTRIPDALPAKIEFPLYAAVMEWLPMLREDVE